MSAIETAHGVGSTLISNLFVKLPYPEAQFNGQTIIVTGSNTGLGFEASKHLCRLGVEKLIMGVRTLEKGEAARSEILEITKRDPATIEVWQIDMESYDSIKRFADRAASLPRLDGLVANAGILTTVFGLAEDNERTITVNVVATFLLCLLLLPRLQSSAAATGVTPHVVIPNSALHYTSPTKELDPSKSIFGTLNNANEADMANRYPLSKLLVIYIIRELALKLATSDHALVVFNTPNPSFCKSQLMRESPSAGLRMAERLLARTTEEGSRVLVHGLAAGAESNGQYLTNCRVHRYVPTPGEHFHNASASATRLTNECSPSTLVTGTKGQQIQKKVFQELVEKLEKISPGISASF